VLTASASKEFADRGNTLDAASAVCAPKVLPAKKTDGFKSVTYRKKSTIGASAVLPVKHCRQPLIGARDFCFLTNYFKEGKVRVEAHFVSILS
jgi:hypothetical protein